MIHMPTVAFFFIVVMAVFPVTAGSRLFYPHLSLPGADADGLQCEQVAGGRQILYGTSRGLERSG